MVEVFLAISEPSEIHAAAAPAKPHPPPAQGTREIPGRKARARAGGTVFDPALATIRH
jgi:hypothetical protein